MMKKYLLSAFLCMLLLYSHAQTLSLDTCYSLARHNFPMLKQLDLISKSAAYSVENAAKGFYPQVSINGQASYQSDVTQVPIHIPGLNIPTISKDQYKVYADVSQALYDGGMTRLQKQAAEANALIEKQNVEISLYQLKERVQQVYFGVLMIRSQMQQSDLLIKDLQTAMDRTKASIANGIALKSSGDIIQAEMLKVKQRLIEFNATQDAYIAMLGLLTGRTLDRSIVLVTPEGQVSTAKINRPELLYYQYRNQALDLQGKQVDAKLKPRVGLFVQGGYGRPALNMLNNEFDFYYIGGLRFSWNLSGLYTSKNEKAVLGINYQLIEAQKETFLLNTSLQISQKQAEIDKFKALLESDDEIIALRGRIKQTALTQLENGVISAGDYLREVNAEDQARQGRYLHELQLLMAQHQQQYNSGN